MINMRRTTALFAVILLAFLLTPPQSSGSQPASPLPYIYYYADTLESLVVERVDGSDSRILAGVPPENTVFTSFDWSPSGEWVAWLNGRWNGPGNVRLTPWVVRSDGGDRCCRVLDDVHDVMSIRWSPVEDVLFVIDRLDFSSIRLLLIDVPADEVLAQFTFKSVAIADFEFPQGDAWFAEGQRAYTIIYALEARTLITLSRTGAVEARVFGGPREYNLGGFNRGRALYITRRPQNDYDPRLIMQDVTTGREVVILAGDPDAVGDACWNTDLTYALVRLRWFNDEKRVSRSEYHLLDWGAGTVTPLSDQLSVNTNQSEFRPGSNIWSDDGRYAALRDGEDGLSVLDAQTGRIHAVDVDNVMAWYWSAGDRSLWIQGGTGDPIRSRIYRYDLALWQLTRIPALDGGDQYSRFQLSPDGKIGASLPGVLGPLVDIETGETLPLVHHSLAQAGMWTEGVVWHPTGDWYMVGERIFYAGGGGGPEAITLYSRDGTLRRELGKCFSYATCAGFVPERAVPHLGSRQAQSVVAEPVLTLKHDKRITGVAWSPDDDLLATYGLQRGNGNEATLTLWRVTGREADIVETFAVDFVCEVHPLACQMTWRDDDTIVFASGYDAWALDLATHEVQPLPTAHFATSPDGLYRFVRIGDAKLTIVDVERDATVIDIEADRETDPNLVFDMWRWLPEEDHTLLFQWTDGRIFRWDGEDIQYVGSGATMYGYAYHEQAELMATGSLYTRISIIDIAAREHLIDINWASSALAFNADGSLLAAGGTELVSVWDTSRFKAGDSGPAAGDEGVQSR